MINYSGFRGVCCQRTALAIGAGIAGAGLLVNVGEGLSQNAKANAIQKSLKDPVYNIPQEFYQNREIARQMAQLGLPQQQYNNAENNINQTQAAAITAAQNSANPGAAITNVVRQGNQQKAKLDAEDAQSRENNQRYFIDQNRQVAGQELAKQQSDVFDKFTRDFNQMQADKGAAMQNFNQAAQGAMSLGETAMNYSAQNPNNGQVAYQKQQFQNRATAPLLTSTGSPIVSDYTYPTTLQ